MTDDAVQRIEDALAKMTGGADGKWQISSDKWEVFCEGKRLSGNDGYEMECFEPHDLAGIVTIRNDTAEVVAKVKRLREALRKQADMCCEYGTDSDVCGKLSVDDCAGCPARGKHWASRHCRRLAGCRVI